MSKDYMPSTEEGFFEWQANFTKKVTDNLAAWNIPPTATEALAKAKGIYDPAYDAANLGKKSTRTPQQTQDKNDATAAYQKAIRKFVRQWLAFNDAITNGQKLALGIRVTDVVRTASGTPESIPDHFCEPVNGSRIKVTVKQQPDEDGSSKRGKPDDASAFDLAVWVGPGAPASADDCLDKRRFTRSPVTIDFDYADAGKTVNFFARWVGKNSQLGRWNRAIEEVIPK